MSGPGSSSVPSSTAHPDQILAWLEALLPFEDGQVELRAFGVSGAKGEKVCKLYDRMDLASLVGQAVALSGRAEGIYFTLSPVRRGVKRFAKDADVERRTLLLIDCDPARDPVAKKASEDGGNLSATDAEKAHAEQLADDVAAYLSQLGWPAPARADSGNGSHLLYRIDLPNDEASRELVRGVLIALGHQFDTADATIDRKVFNASRITKLYGTVARKGSATPDRPHRASRVLDIPEGFGRVAVGREMLQAVADLVVVPEPAPIPAPTKRSRRVEGREWSVEDRAVAYLAKVPGAVSGQNGHDDTFKAACKVGPGFDLSPEATFRVLLDHWNPTCQPPWSEVDLRRKVDEAFRVEARRGFLLEAERRRGVRPPGRGTEGEPGQADGDDRPKVLITTDEMDVNDRAIRSLGKDRNLFCRGQDLVIVRRERRKNRLVNRPDESPWISVIPRSTLRERLSRVVRWMKQRRFPNSTAVEEVPAHPPDWSVAAIADRGDWEGIRHLEEIVEAPSLLSDGSILEVPGYDSRSGLVYEPSGDFPPIPQEITQADARAAAEELLAVVADFPFEAIGNDCGATHRCAWLAGLLTLLARHAIDAACPLFLIDANAPGSGKTLLVDLISYLATGRPAARTAFPEHEEEMRKLILAIALEGDRLILMDNIATGADLGGASLDGVLTGTTVKGRILGRTETSREVPIYTVWFATGNNLGLRGDLLRRIVPFRLESPHERPEERTDFRVKDLRGYVRANRGRLVVAGLKILRGHFLAGRPTADLIPMDYPEWCGVVRQALYWATGIDPCETRRELIALNPESHMARAAIVGWAELPGGRSGLTAAEALRILQDPDLQQRYTMLRDVLTQWTRDGKLPSPVVIGKRFKALEDRAFDGWVMRGVIYQGVKRWAAVQVADLGSGGGEGVGGGFQGHAGKLLPGFEDSRDENDGRYLPPHGSETPTNPLTPTDDRDEEVAKWLV